jgi:hypothetical protein
MPFEILPIPSIPFLAELREEVLKHSLKRMPKWKFRLASDLVLQLQPKPTVLLSEAAMARGFKPKLQHFEGVTVMLEGVTGDVFKCLPVRSAPLWWQIKFELYTQSPDTDWVFHQTSWRRPHGAGQPGIDTIVHRVIAAFRGGLFGSSMPAKMLSYNCVICGKGLTDPASMARWIGPECAGTSTLRVPFVITAEAAKPIKDAMTLTEALPGQPILI